MTDHPIPAPALWTARASQRIAEINPCAGGCRGDCAQGDRECEFIGIRPAEASREFAGPPDWEAAPIRELLGDASKGLFKASVVVTASLLAIHAGLAFGLWLRGVL